MDAPFVLAFPELCFFISSTFASVGWVGSMVQSNTKEFVLLDFVNL